MSNHTTIMVVTANDLIDGDAVWLTPDKDWTRDIRKAETIENERAAQSRLGEAESHPGKVIGPYLAEVRHGPAGAEPVHFREIFRTRGPSNYPHGKQEIDPGVEAEIEAEIEERICVSV